MTSSDVLRPSADGIRAGSDPERLRAALAANLVLQGLIIVTGGLVRLTGSGLGCPTWPQCTPGSFTPVAHQEQGWHTFVEFGNRLMTFVLAAVAVWLVVAAARRSVRLGTPAAKALLAWCVVPLVGILLQAVVGGIIVLTKLDPKTVSPHFLLSAALVSFSAWLLVRHDDEERGVQDSADAPRGSLALLGRITGAVFALVVVLGTAVTGSGPHSGDKVENLRFGFDPVVTSRFHSASVWLFVVLVIAMALLSHRARDTAGTATRGRALWLWVLGLSVVEGAVGYTQYAMGLPIGLVAAHLTLSAVLAAVVTFAVLSSVRARP